MVDHEHCTYHQDFVELVWIGCYEYVSVCIEVFKVYVLKMMVVGDLKWYYSTIL